MAERITVGWREWLALPELGIHAIKAKIDTGARTSALHTFRIEPFTQAGVSKVRFYLRPRKKWPEHYLVCESPIIDQRWVIDSGGHGENRYVIATPIQMGEAFWLIEMTLTNRDMMRFPMLLGRTAMRGRLIVDPQASYVLGKPPHLKRIHAC